MTKISLVELLSAFAAERVSAETKELQAILEHDRTAIADGVVSLENVIREREWLGEGRGPYEWDDDRWHKEFNDTASEIRAALKPLSRIAADLTNCPTDAAEVQAARGAAWKRLRLTAWEDRALKAEREVEQLKTALEEQRGRN